MNTKSLVRRIGGFLMAALMVAGVGVASTDTAQAQRRGRVIIVRPIRPYWGYRRPWGWDGYGYYNQYSQYVFSNSGRAEDQGYRDGQKTGSEDGRKNKSYDPERSHYFQEAGFGNFAEAYRDGFDHGYSDGYRNANRG
jgi:hypothetical protein